MTAEMVTPTKKMRESNIELLRVICMLLIIAHHAALHGGAASDATGMNQLVALFLLPGGKLGFVTFLVISCYFLVDKKFNALRFIKTYLQVLFYSILFYSIAVILGGDFSWRTAISVFFPIAGNSHGFAATYLAFYLVTPFFAIIAEHITKRQLDTFLGLLIYYQIITKILGPIFAYSPGLVSNELTLFALVYFVVLRLKRYPLTISLSRRAMWAVLAGMWLVMVIIYMLPVLWGKKNIFSLLHLLCIDESSILFLLAGGLLFWLFKSIKIKPSNVINTFAKVSFGVLLFHDHNILRPILWHDVLKSDHFYQGNHYLLWVLASVVAIYLFGMVVDLLRERLFNVFLSGCMQRTAMVLENRFKG